MVFMDNLLNKRRKLIDDSRENVRVGDNLPEVVWYWTNDIYSYKYVPFLNA